VTDQLDFWQTKTAWPKDRSGEYIFLLEVLNQVCAAMLDADNRKKKNSGAPLSAYWTPTARVLWPCQGRGLPPYELTDLNEQPEILAEINDGVRICDRSRAHDALLWSDFEYFPHDQPIFEWQGEISMMANTGYSQYAFSAEQWQRANAILSASPIDADQREKTFAVMEKLVVGMASQTSSSLATVAQRINGGAFIPIAREGWLISSDAVLRARFAFGQISESGVLYDEKKQFSTSPRGDYWIFVKKIDLDIFLLSGGAKLRNDKLAELWLASQEAKDLHDGGLLRHDLIFQIVERFGLLPTEAESVWEASAPDAFRKGGRPKKADRVFTGGKQN
jgi:hypothetical protein